MPDRSISWHRVRVTHALAGEPLCSFAGTFMSPLDSGERGNEIFHDIVEDLVAALAAV